MQGLRTFGIVTLTYFLLAGGPAASIEPETDANVVTGLDFSHSVSLDDHRIVQEGLVQALLSPEVLHAIQAGHHGRIGFTVFGWHTKTLPILPWMLIGSADDAAEATQRIRVAIGEQIAAEANLRRVEKRFGRPTDLSQALSSAAAMLQTATFRSARSVINIIGNGPDNVNKGPQAARDAALALGFTINGVVLGQEPDVITYFQDNVIGGPGSFVEHVPSAEVIANIFKRKFINDIVIGFAFSPQPDSKR